MNSERQIKDIRIERLDALIKSSSLGYVSEKTKKPKSQLVDMIAGRKTFGEKVARSMEKNANLAAGYFDIDLSKTNAATKIQEPANTYSTPLTMLLESLNKLPTDQRQKTITAISEYLDLPQEIQEMIAQNINNFHKTWAITHKPNTTTTSETTDAATQNNK